MASTDYIWISEAVKVYDKTRQTFYNYINKDQIQTKKIKNKLYLKQADIEYILSEQGYQTVAKNTLSFAEKQSRQQDLIDDPNDPTAYTPTAYVVGEGMSDELTTRLDLLDDYLATLQETQEQLQTDQEQQFATLVSRQDQQFAAHMHQIEQHMNQQTNSVIHLAQNNQRYLLEQLSQTQGQLDELHTHITQQRVALLQKKYYFWLGYGLCVLLYLVGIHMLLIF